MTVTSQRSSRALVLIALGSGTVKGFAYTLMIGIVLSMFTALVVTRWILYSFYAIGIRDEKFYGRAKERRTLNFLGKRGVFFAVSLASGSRDLSEWALCRPRDER